MVAPAGVNDGSTAEPAHQEPPEPPEPLTPTAAVVAQAADADPSAADTARPELAAAGLPMAGPVAEEPVTTEWVEPAGLRPGPGAQPGPERERRRGRGLGVAVFVLVVIVLVGGAVGGLAKVTHGFHRKTVVTYRPAAVFKLRTGECVNFGPNGQSVTVLSCATPHDAEVFATFPLPASPWPGGAVVQQDASNGCASRLDGYLNPQLADAGLDQEFFYPDQEAWQAGARTVVCGVRAPTGQLTGSVRDVS
jgi:hypothetical protein